MSIKSKTVLDVQTIPQVELDFMNQTHLEEVDMVKRLGEAVSSYIDTETPTQQDRNAINTQLTNWVNHTEAHFARENKLMQETGFPAYEIHSSEHELALNKLRSVTRHWQTEQNIDLLEDYIFSQWPNWFETHVSTMDMITAQFAKMNGYNDIN